LCLAYWSWGLLSVACSTTLMTDLFHHSWHCWFDSWWTVCHHSEIVATWSRDSS
jgi:hypothetical protein